MALAIHNTLHSQLVLLHPLYLSSFTLEVHQPTTDGDSSKLAVALFESKQHKLCSRFREEEGKKFSNLETIDQ